MTDLVSIKISNRQGGLVCFDDEGTYEQGTRTLAIKTARWLIRNPETHIGEVFRVEGKAVITGDPFVADMTFVQETNNASRCRFVGV